jgi:hypothetical protein
MQFFVFSFFILRFLAYFGFYASFLCNYRFLFLFSSYDRVSGLFKVL